MNIKDYPFKYETHMHTMQGSACARSTGADMARAYKEAGYTGIIITDHFFYGNTAVDRSLGWEEWVANYCKGYEDAYQEGRKIDLQVFFGWESGYHGTEFLIYGLDKEWLMKHPEIKDATVEEQYKLVHQAGGIVIHAHPFRKAGYIPEIRLFPDYVDGVEAKNWAHEMPGSSHADVTYNPLAEEYAAKYNFPITAGSDAHNAVGLKGGMAFQRKLTDIHDFTKAILSKEPNILFFDKGKSE